MPFLWNLGCQPAKKVGRTQGSVAKWSSANKIRVHYGIWWHLQESRDSSLMGNTQFPRDRRGWGVCPAWPRTPSLRSPQSQLGDEIKSCSTVRVSALSACVCSRLTFERDRVMALMFPLSLGQKANSMIATCPGELQLLSAKEKAFIEYHCMHWRGKTSEKMLGVGWGGF